MTDTPPIDMAAFFARHDRVTRRTFVATIAVSLAVSAGSLGYAALAAESPRPVGAELWVQMVLIPLFLIAFRAAVLRWGGKRPMLPDGSLPMIADDARSARQVANAGAVFVAGLGVAVIATQASAALEYFDAFASLGGADEWLGRAGLAGMGGLMVYFGNAWPRMPTPRAPDQKPATQKTFNRRYGWMVVTTGLLFVLAALLLPGPAMAAVVGVASLGLVLGVTAITVRFYRAMKSPQAS
jgi:hypothetical protein